MRRVTWSILKQAATVRGIDLQIIDLGSVYDARMIDGTFQLMAMVQKSDPASSDQADLEENFLPTANQRVDSNVITALEKDDKSLALASAEGQFDGTTCKLSIKVPGVIGQVGRYIKEGYAFCDVYAWGMRLERAALVDKEFLYAGLPGFYPATPEAAGIPGTEGLSWADIMPDGVELGDYCDKEVLSVNKGWRLWADEGGQGGCDIDNLAGYGDLYGQAYLELEFSKPAGAVTTTSMAANLQWGSQK